MTAPADRDDLLPASAAAFERAQSKTSGRCLDAPVDAIRLARQGATAPAALLGHLGWERSLHHPSADTAAMRARIDASFSDHLGYGAPAALEAEIAADTGQTVAIVEFNEAPELQWPDFMVESVVDPGSPLPDAGALLASALRRKNVRDWPVKARLRLRLPPGAIYVASASHYTVRVTIRDRSAPPPHLFIGSATWFRPHVTVLPARPQ